MNSRPSILGFLALAFGLAGELRPAAGAGEVAPTVEEYTAELEKEQAAFEKLSQSATTFPQTLQWLQREIEKARRPDAPVSYHFDEVFRLACARATNPELEQLKGIILALPDKGFDFENSFAAYVIARLRMAVAGLQHEPRHFELPKPALDPPKALDKFPPEYREAWIAWHSARQPYERLAKEMAEAVHLKPRKPPLDLTADLHALLQTPSTAAWQQLFAHEWGSPCGTGMWTLYHPRNRGILLGLLEENKLPEAIGCAFEQMNERDRDPDLSAWTKELLTAAGLDWELVYLGSLLPETEEQIATPWSGNDDLREIDALGSLAAFGSPRGVRYGLQFLRKASMIPDGRTTFLDLAAGPEPTRPGVVSSGPPRLARKEALPAELRAEILAQRAESLAPDRPGKDLWWALRSVPPHLTKELRVPLEKLMTRPEHPIAAEARQLLADAGLVAPDAPIAPAPPPLRLHVTTNGEPLRETELTVEGDLGHQLQKTDQDGRLRVSLEETLNPEDIHMVTVKALPPDSQFEHWEEDLLSPGTALRKLDPAPIPGFPPDIPGIPGLDAPAPKAVPSHSGGPWLSASVPVKVGEEREYEIPVQTASLEIAIDPASPIEAQTLVTMYLTCGPPDTPGSELVRLTGTKADSFVFERLQRRDYRLEIRAFGAAVYQSGAISVGKAGSIRLIKLDPGRQVTGKLVSSFGDKSDLWISAELFRDGKRFELSHRSWQGLPLGKYRLHVPSSTEDEAAMRVSFPAYSIPDGERRTALDYEFELKADSPPVVDLGELREVPEHK